VFGTPFYKKETLILRLSYANWQGSKTCSHSDIEWHFVKGIISRWQLVNLWVILGQRGVIRSSSPALWVVEI